MRIAKMKTKEVGKKTQKQKIIYEPVRSCKSC